VSENGNGNGSTVKKPRPPRPREYRCPACRRLLFVALLSPGSHVEVRCTRSKCSRMVVIDEPVLLPRPAQIVAVPV
jgi:hypothetical protein